MIIRENLPRHLWDGKNLIKAGSSVVYIDKTNVPSIGPRAFIDPKKLSYSGTLPIDSDEMPTNLNFTDPWGNEYIYKYRTSASGDLG